MKMQIDDLVFDLKIQIINQLNLQDVTPEDIGSDEPLFGGGLGLDSIDALELVAILQEIYKIQLGSPEDGPKVLSSVRTMAEYIATHQVMS